MNPILLAVGVLLMLSCGVTGSLALLYRARRLRLRAHQYGLAMPFLRHLAAVIGALAGLTIGGLGAYYLSLNQQVSPIEWIGRFSYVLIAWAGGSHLLSLVHHGVLLRREEQGWKRQPEEAPGTLGERRRQTLLQLRQHYRHYLDLKSRDDELVDELVGVLGTPLLSVRRDLGRIPLYGYLGTVCGILLMAEELSQIDEAAQTFKVLGSMAGGLVLAFKTTLVGLLTYLPLRKGVDYLIQRVGALEDNWIHLRDQEEWAS